MTWVKIDDAMPMHPKMLDLGLEGIGLWVCMLAYCNRLTTGGRVPKRHLAAVYGGAGARRLGELTEKMRGLNLVCVEAGDILLVNYERYQSEAMPERARERREYLAEKKKESRARQQSVNGLSTVDSAARQHGVNAPVPSRPVQTSPKEEYSVSVSELRARAESSEQPKTTSRFGADELAEAIDAELRGHGAGSFGQMLPGNVAHHASSVLAFFRRESEIQGRPPDELVRESVADYLASDYVKSRKSKTVGMKQWFEDPGRNTPWNRKKELQKQLTPRQDQAVWRLENNAMLYDDDESILREMGLL